MKYKKFIEDFFYIDEPTRGELVPFKFNRVQEKFYKELCERYDIEKNGTSAPVREIILKARREGFSSLILALFAADDILTENPTIAQVMSYKDDATKRFRKRYKTFVLSYYAKKAGLDVRIPAAQEELQKRVFARFESGEYTHRENNAEFICGTASARTGERGGVLQKLLFSEAAFYPDTEVMTAEEIIEGTLRQVDISSGWVFIETTGKRGVYFERLWRKAIAGQSRFHPTFYGAKEFYDDKQLEIIKSEHETETKFKQEYPITWEDAFLSSEESFVTMEELEALVDNDQAPKEIAYWLELQGNNYIDQCEIIKNALVTFEKKYPNSKLYAGVDVAKDKDRTVLTVLKDRKYNLYGGLMGIAIDSTGVGDFMPDWFANNSRWFIKEIKFSRPQKDILYRRLRTVIKDRLTSIGRIKDGGEYVSEEAKRFIKEMLDLKKEMKGELLVVGHPEGDYHDDYPDSWALAEDMYYHYEKPQAQDEKPNIGDLPDPVERLLSRAEAEKQERKERVSYR